MVEISNEVLVDQFYKRIKDVIEDPLYLNFRYPKIAVLIGYHPLRWAPTRTRLRQALMAWVAGTGSSSRAFWYSEPGLFGRKWFVVRDNK